MRQRNTMEYWEYRLDLLFWSTMVMFWYRTILFRPVFALSSRQSKVLLWVLVVGCVLVGYLLSRRTRRNGLNASLTVLFPFEVYAMLTYGRYFPRIALGALAVGGVLALAYGLWVLLSPIRRPEERRTILLRRTAVVLLGGRTILCACTLVILGMALAAAMRGGVLLMPSQRAEDGYDGTEDTISGHIEELTQLQAEVWAELPMSERLDLLQTVANIERTYLGVPHELRLGAAELEEGVMGRYNSVTNQIVLSLEHLAEDDAGDILDTVLHECYHAYQHSLVELYGQSPERYRDLQLFSAAQDYAEEMRDYQDGEDFSAYYSQRMERDARVYAEAGVTDYGERIAAYLAGEE